MLTKYTIFTINSCYKQFHTLLEILSIKWKLFDRYYYVQCLVINLHKTNRHLIIRNAFWDINIRKCASVY